ncbi:MAG: hypothetical protein K0S86_2965 [Geminicoccaceae bacterium]|jgi:hypothetical protein|nr:hypothetical protein [Geminicoccaceae bacterium]
MRGGRAARDGTSLRAVPPLVQAAGASDRAAARHIFVILPILLILSILSPPFPGPVAMPPGSRDARSA